MSNSVLSPFGISFTHEFPVLTSPKLLKTVTVFLGVLTLKSSFMFQNLFNFGTCDYKVDAPTAILMLLESIFKRKKKFSVPKLYAKQKLLSDRS